MDLALQEPSFPFTSVFAVSTLALATTYYIFSVAKKPRIYTSNKKLLQFIQKHVTSLNEKYFPNYLIWDGRLQSILGLSLRLPDSHNLPYTREILILKDGGELGLDFLFPENADKDSLVVFVLPGLTSSSQTCYVKTLVLSVVSSGSIAVVLNNRGLGGVPLKNPRMYCAANFEDVEEVLAHLNKKYPVNRKIAIGTSMGAMVICKYLTARPDEAKKTLSAVLVISSIWDALRGIESLEKPFINRYIINNGITQNLLFLAKKYRNILEVRDCYDYDKILECSNVRDFDSHFTAPAFGFSSVQDYYLHASTLETISKFSIPVFALNAEDDPFSPGHALPIEHAEAPGSNFVLITTTRGGHLGYLEGIFPTRRTAHFMERVVDEFVRAVKLQAHELV